MEWTLGLGTCRVQEVMRRVFLLQYAKDTAESNPDFRENHVRPSASRVGPVADSLLASLSRSERPSIARGGLFRTQPQTT